MTREKLQSLSEEQLQCIAKREGIYNHNDTQREKLVDLILEALEEDRDERELSNNSAMRLEHKKYDILRDEEIDLLTQDEFPLPDTYTDTRIVLLLRDPHWVYVYWDVNRTQLDALKGEPFFDGLFLRVYEFNGDTPEKSNINDFFDIPIGEADRSWYINLNRTGNDYYVDLRCRVMHKERLMAASNAVHSPRGYFARNQKEFYNDPNTMMLMLSGLWNYEEGTVESQEIPHRIISILDTHNIELETSSEK
ncbi:MAG TPA: DUF4912 domain-containing protein [Clostridia bacterium]|nr:DUF4912 domain-containing protein [Clostridia bacterium]